MSIIKQRVINLYTINWRSSRNLSSSSKVVPYIQGQWVEKVREYFYFVDHEGQLFMDDARMKNFTSAFKDKVFLDFFFRRLKINQSERYTDTFPYISPCGREMNYLRCDDRPIVFTDLDEQEEKLVYNFTTKKIKFEPAKLCMFPNGRLYHSAHFDNYGLVKSKLADRLFPRFRFSSEGNPTHFYWKDEWIELDNEFLKYAVQK